MTASVTELMNAGDTSMPYCSTLQYRLIRQLAINALGFVVGTVARSARAALA